MALLHRITRQDAPSIPYTLDGIAREGREGDTVMTAILTSGDLLRRNIFSGAPSAGFCQMGACQDCWVGLEGGGTLRACSTPLTAGLSLVTGRPG